MYVQTSANISLDKNSFVSFERTDIIEIVFLLFNIKDSQFRLMIVFSPCEDLRYILFRPAGKEK